MRQKNAALPAGGAEKLVRSRGSPAAVRHWALRLPALEGRCVPPLQPRSQEGRQQLEGKQELGDLALAVGSGGLWRSWTVR